MHDFRVDRHAVSQLADGAYFWALVEPVWPSVDDQDERAHLLSATRGQRILYSTMLLSRDVANGGLWQAFWNFEPWFMALAENSFARLGAAEQSGALRSARDLLSQIPMQGNEETRRDYLESRRATLLPALEGLDPCFYNEEGFYPLYHRYIVSHSAEFFKP